MELLLLSQAATTSTEAASDVLSDLAPPLQVALLLGSLTFASAALVSVTAFTRIIIVLSFVRRALSTQEIPPNQVLLGLSFFLTLFVMAPTFEAIHRDAVVPFLDQQQAEKTNTDTAETENSAESVGIASEKSGKTDSPSFSFSDAWDVTSHELKKFMMHHTRTADLALFFDLSKVDPPSERLDTPMKIMVPAFVISELKTAFIMGFCIYIPFLLIDLVVSTILMALGMMMMPPVVVSTPCKLLLFVLVDGWQLIVRALVSSFGTT